MKLVLHINTQAWAWPTVLKVEIMSDAALKLRESKLTVSRTDIYDKVMIFQTKNYEVL